MREIELTSYAEVVSGERRRRTPRIRHSPRCSCRRNSSPRAGRCWRRAAAASPDEPPLWMFHHCVVEGDRRAPCSSRPIGRDSWEGDEICAMPRRIVDAGPLSNTTGTVLDPVLALRRRVRIAPAESARIAFWSGVAPSRAAGARAGRQVSRHGGVRARCKSPGGGPALRRSCAVWASMPSEAQQFQRIASRVLYADASLRASREILERNALGPSALWSLGISGDLPIVLAQIDDGGPSGDHRAAAARAPLLAGEAIGGRSGHAQRLPGRRSPRELQQAIGGRDRSRNRARRAAATATTRAAAGYSCCAGDAMPPSNRELLQTAARAIFAARAGSLSDQLARSARRGYHARRRPAAAPSGARPRHAARTRRRRRSAAGILQRLRRLRGRGARVRHRTRGGTMDPCALDQRDRQSAIRISGVRGRRRQHLVASTRSRIRSRRGRNDPVSNAPAEAIYIRDEDSGDLWSATPLPIREPPRSIRRSPRLRIQPLRTCLARHRLGAAAIRAARRSDQDLAPENRQSLARRRAGCRSPITWSGCSAISAAAAAPFIVTELDPETSALLARNPWSTDFQAASRLHGHGRSAADAAPAIARNSSAATDRWPNPRRCSGRSRFRIGSAAVSIPAARCRRRFSLQPGEEAELDAAARRRRHRRPTRWP